MQYNQYLQTDHWKDKRTEKLNSRPFCQVCNTTNNLHIHHKKYKYREGDTVLFKERIQDLITLCSSCHNLIHKHFGIEVKKVNKKILRIKVLLKFGIKKNVAFFIVSKPNVYESVYLKLHAVKKHGNTITL